MGRSLRLVRTLVIVAALVFVTGIVVAVVLPESRVNCDFAFDPLGPCPDPQIGLRVVIAAGGTVIAGILLAVARRIGRRAPRSSR